jgi:hypothetical protein
MEGKNSFILYVNTIDIVNDLTDEQAGILFKTISNYVNDRYPPEPENQAVKIAWKIIRGQLKRDLEKWEDSKGKKSEGAKIGNLKRWHKDIYDAYKKKEIDLEQAFSIASNRNGSHSDDIQSVPISKQQIKKHEDVQLPDDDQKDDVPKKEAKLDEARIRKATKVIADYFDILEVQQASSYLKIGRFVIFRNWRLRSCRRVDGMG